MKPEILSKNDIELITALLRKLKPGNLPRPIFEELAHLTTQPILEMVPLAIINGKTHVLMTQRPNDDPYWPGEMHTPGTVIRADDKVGSFDSPANRILRDELAGIETTGDLVVFDTIYRRSKRGPELAVWTYTQVNSNNPPAGKFFDVDNLPPNTVEIQISSIKKAAELLKNQISSQS